MPKISTTYIDETLLYQHWTCPHWEYFRCYAPVGTAKRQHKFARQLLLNDLLPDSEVKNLPTNYTQVTGRTFSVRAKSTLQLMKNGAECIWKPALQFGDFRGQPDYLERRAGKSALGDYYYLAVDIKNGDRANPGNKIQAGLYGFLLEKIQDRLPDQGYVATVPFVSIFSVPMDEGLAMFHEAVNEIRSARSGEVPLPYISSGCKQSPWFKLCVELAEKNDDIALLYNLRESAMRKLRQHGICSLELLRRSDPARLAREISVPRDTLERHHLQAECLKNKTHLFREQPEFPTTEIEIAFDIEGDPLRPAEYLFGIWWNNKYEYIIAENPADEEQAWKKFLSWLEKIPPGDLNVYHFGNYEISRLSYLGQRYGGSVHLDRFRAAMIDLAEVVKQTVILPLYFYSLKDIGRYIGVDRSKAIAAGGESVSWYESWLATNKRQKLDTIINYNREDVEATMALKNWLVEQGSKKNI